jgi:biopolymer transport protein ExbD
VISVRKGGKIYINKAPIARKDLAKKLSKVLEGRKDREVFLKADHRVSYGTVAKVMGEIREAGVVRLGMVTEPERR